MIFELSEKTIKTKNKVVMSLRAIWIVSLCQDFGKVYYSRIFQTVEKRAQKLYKDLFVKSPKCDEFGKSLLIKLGLNSPKEFIEWRDSACSQIQLPVLSLKTSEGDLWPILVIEQHGYLFCCLPLIEEKFENDKKISLFQIQSLSVGFSVLLGIISLLGSVIPSEISNKFIELDNYLSLSMPFGETSDIEPSTVRSILQLPESDLGTVKTALKQPAWKPINYKGKSSMLLHLTEFVRCVQCDKPGVQTVLNVYGNITMKVEMEGTQVDITLTLSNYSSEKFYMDSLVLHPCAQLSTSLMLGREKVGNSSTIKKLRISPPLHKFILCYYTTNNNKEIPILGSLKLRGEKIVDILLQLKLNESLKTAKNQFDFCEARIPFLNRDCIKNADFNSNCGHVQISEDRHSIIWNIGQKFPGKYLEASLVAKVYFKDYPNYSEDNSISYAQLFFKQSNCTLSGYYIDSNSIHISPSNKIKLQIAHELQSCEYKIWNSCDEMPFCTSLPS